jgi:hypothetical protein
MLWIKFQICRNSYHYQKTKMEISREPETPMKIAKIDMKIIRDR